MDHVVGVVSFAFAELCDWFKVSYNELRLITINTNQFVFAIARTDSCAWHHMCVLVLAYNKRSLGKLANCPPEKQQTSLWCAVCCSLTYQVLYAPFMHAA